MCTGRKDGMVKPYGTIKRVSFDEERHAYAFDGKPLKGVTSAIGRYMGKSFPDSGIVRLACSYGSQVHKESERWINEGRPAETENGRWVVEQLKMLKEKFGGDGYGAEVRVSDFEGTASNVDAVLHLPADSVVLIDIKTGAFDREYCSLQLSVYKMLYEASYPETVVALLVLNTKARRIFTIFLRDEAVCRKILRMNKEAE